MNEGLNLETVGLDEPGYRVDHDGGWEAFKRAVRRGEKRFYRKRGELPPAELTPGAMAHAEVVEARNRWRRAEME